MVILFYKEKILILQNGLIMTQMIMMTMIFNYLEKQIKKIIYIGQRKIKLI